MGGAARQRHPPSLCLAWSRRSRCLSTAARRAAGRPQYGESRSRAPPISRTVSSMTTTALLTRQHSDFGVCDDVVTTAQAVALHGRGHVRAQLVGRRWQRPTRGVLVLHNGPLTTSQLAWAALLCCPAGSAPAGLSALTIDGLEGFQTRSDRPQVVLPEGASRPSSDLVTPYWSTELTSRDVHPLKQPRRTRPQRSMVDEASWVVGPAARPGADSGGSSAGACPAGRPPRCPLASRSMPPAGPHHRVDPGC